MSNSIICVLCFVELLRFLPGFVGTNDVRHKFRTLDETHHFDKDDLVATS